MTKRRLKLSAYKSLNLPTKIYQVKSLRYVEELLKPKQKFLELGCADGSLASYVSKATKTQAYGVDVSIPSINEAKKKGVNARVHDLSKKLPYKKAEFNLLISLEVIEHLLDTDFFMEEVSRVLKKDGYLILSTPNLASLTNRIRILFGKYPKHLDYQRHGWDNHVHLYTPGTLKSQLLENKFEVIKVTSPNFFHQLLLWPLNNKY